MREAVDAFKEARDKILQFARTPIPIAAPSSPKRKAAELEEIEDTYSENKRPRMSTRSSKARGAEATAAMAREEADAPEGFSEEPEIGTSPHPLYHLPY
jgi:E3 ubiquitin-protein ligase RAD18